MSPPVKSLKCAVTHICKHTLGVMGRVRLRYTPTAFLKNLMDIKCLSEWHLSVSREVCQTLLVQAFHRQEVYSLVRNILLTILKECGNMYAVDCMHY